MAADGSALTPDVFRRITDALGFTLPPQDAADYYELLQRLDADLRAVDALPAYEDPRLAPVAVPAAERVYTVPGRADNPFNAWSHRFELKDDRAVADGLLAGRAVAVKDTVAVAGIPHTLGTFPHVLSADAAAYPVPEIDAPVVRRIVAAGGVLRGTATCENLCMSGLSFTSATGPVDNPWLRGYAAGGSSSGCAALLALRTVRAWRARRGLPVDDGLGDGVDLAVGGDQGGSIRLPAAYSGVYGLKPTHGLVPYTGIAALHPACDHAGPMATSVADVALFLSVLAGYDGLDPRCGPGTPLPGAVPAYHEQLAAAIAERQTAGTWTPTAAGRGLRVGLLREALELPELDPAVAGVVRAAAAQFARVGAAVVDVSVPLHRLGNAIWSAALRGSMADVLVRGAAPEMPAYALPQLAPPPPTQAWYEAMTAASPMVVAALFTSAYMGDRARFPPARWRNKAAVHALQLRAAYDAVFEGPDGVDVLLLPVTPTVAPRHTDMATKSALEKHLAGLGVSGNTGPFNLTGHPALALPGGWAPVADGPGKLPVGIQLVGRHHDELGVLLAASMWEVGGMGLDKE